MFGDNFWLILAFELGLIIVAFLFGLLMTKNFARLLTKYWKKLRNDPVSINLVFVRIYEPNRINELNAETFHSLQQRIPNVKLDFVSRTAMRIGMLPFGTVKIIHDEGVNNEQNEEIENVKISISIENPIRIGIRQIDDIHQYSNNVEIIFQILENNFLEKPVIIKNYAVAEIDRSGRFLEEKTFDIKNDELAARIQGTPNKITIMAEPPNYIAKAVKRYMLI